MNGEPKSTLDKLSWKILKELCANARVTNAEIGRRVGLSSPAVADRILKMEEQGFIKGHHTVVDYDKVGLTIQAFITFKATTVKHHEMLKIVDAIPEVMEWQAITGNACMLLKVAAYSGKELESVIAYLGEFGETSTSLILSESSSSKGFKKIFAGNDSSSKDLLKK
jgi:Lrp/AsnC family transcriptional regulator, leucine-responsive regulatory protein